MDQDQRAVLSGQKQRNRGIQQKEQMMLQSCVLSCHNLARSASPRRKERKKKSMTLQPTSSMGLEDGTKKKAWHRCDSIDMVTMYSRISHGDFKF